MNKLPVVSFVLSILSFFWIGLRRDLPQLQKLLTDPGATGKAKAIFHFLLPYLLGAAGVIFLLITALRTPPVEIRYHALREIKPADGDPIEVDGRTQVEVASRLEHFQILVSGQIFGPELKQLKEYFGSLQDVRVYVVVTEESRPRTKGLCWLQKSEFGNLNPQGRYASRVYLGGTGKDKAGDRELFSIRLYIPDRNIEFPEYTTYNPDQLPRALFVSEPFYITTRRPSEESREPTG